MSVNYCFLAFRKNVCFFFSSFSLLLFGNYIFHLRFQRRVRITLERVTFRNGNCAARCNRFVRRNRSVHRFHGGTKTNCAQQDYSSFAFFFERFESNVVFFIWISNYKYGCVASHMFSWKRTTKRKRTYFELLEFIHRLISLFWLFGKYLNNILLFGFFRNIFCFWQEEPFLWINTFCYKYFSDFWICKMSDQIKVII